MCGLLGIYGQKIDKNQFVDALNLQKHRGPDDFGYFALEDRVHVHDINATILHCLGINHESLTFHHQGRDFKLTDEFGKVVDNIII